LTDEQFQLLVIKNKITNEQYEEIITSAKMGVE
jgi:hypothetical protein